MAASRIGNVTFGPQFAIRGDRDIIACLEIFFRFRHLPICLAASPVCVRERGKSRPRDKAMSAQAPAPLVEPPPSRSQVVKSNRLQVLLYAVLTLLLTGATVWGGRVLLTDSETLTFAVGTSNSEEAQFAAKLAAVLRNIHSRLRLKILPSADNAKAVGLFDRRQADLAILRTDSKIPPRARAVAILDHDLVMLLSPGTKKIKSLDDLKKLKKVAILAEADSSAAFIRTIFDLSDSPETASKVQMAPPGATLEKLFASGFGAVI
ncbi:MAG: hypothetical protein JOZ74_14085, partial [Bradyrhizobium sp.]|nr:hypothetical protein [Bradyrhizobium sp.]